MATRRDYYEVLGIPKSSSEAEIKSAYRKLARKHHPDVDKSTDAADKFKEISEAYQVLSDPQKKQTYDKFGHAAFEPGSGFGAGASSGGNPFGGGFSYSWSSNGGQGGPFDGAQGGFADPFDLFEQIFGMSGFADEFARGFRRRQTYQMEITFDEAVHGANKEVEIERVEGNHNERKRERLTIKIPAGVDNGTRMRFGDVDIVFRVRPDSHFVREGADIFTDATLTIPQIVLGDIIEVKTIDGLVKLKVPPGAEPGSLIRIKDKGAFSLKGSRGDHFVRVKLQVPKNVSGREKELFEQLRDMRATKKKGWF